MAEDSLVTALSFYTDDGTPLPRPCLALWRPIIEVPPLVAGKLALHHAILSAGSRIVELIPTGVDIDSHVMAGLGLPVRQHQHRLV